MCAFLAQCNTSVSFIHYTHLKKNQVLFPYMIYTHDLQIINSVGSVGTKVSYLSTCNLL